MGIFRKTEADNLLGFDVYWLNKHGYLSGFKAGTIRWSNSFSDNKSSIWIICNVMDDPSLRLKYTQADGGEKTRFDYRIRLVPTECNYGGKRWWFVCPLNIDGEPCRRRVGKLYKDGDYFGCRHCYDLTYRSKNICNSGSWFGAFSFYDVDKKIEELEQKTRRKFYAGKPTRNQRRLYKLYERSSVEYSKIELGILR